MISEYEKEIIYETHKDVEKITRIMRNIDHNFHMIIDMNLASSVIRNTENIFNNLSEELYQKVAEYEKEQTKATKTP